MVRRQIRRLERSGRTPVTRGTAGIPGLGRADRVDPEFINLKPLTDQLERKILVDHRDAIAGKISDGAAFASAEQERMAQLSEVLKGTVGSEKDPGVRSTKLKAGLRRAVELGIVPATADPVWLQGAVDQEAGRLMDRARRQLETSVSDFSAITGEDGDLVEPPDAREFANGVFDEILQNPLMQAPTARDIVTNQRQDAEAQFLQSVTRARDLALEQRTEALKVRRLSTGDTLKDGRGFDGLVELGRLGSGVEATQSFQDFIRVLRDEENTPNVERVVARAIAQRVDKLAEDDPAAAERLLDRVGLVEVTPGLPINEDDRFTNGSLGINLHALEQRVANSKADELTKAASAQRTLAERIQTSFGAEMTQYLLENPGATSDQAFEAAKIATAERQDVQEILDAAGIAEVPSYLEADLKAQSRKIRATVRESKGESDLEIASNLERMRLQNADPEMMDHYAYSEFLSGRLSPQGYRAHLETSDPINEVSKALKEVPEYAQAQELLSRSRRPDGLPPTADARLDDLALDAERAMREAAARDAGTGATSGERFRAMSKALRDDPAVKASLDAYNKALQEIDTTQNKDLTAFSTALQQGRFEDAERSLATLPASGNVRARLKGELDSARSRFDDQYLQSRDVSNARATLRDSYIAIQAAKNVPQGVANQRVLERLNEFDARVSAEARRIRQSGNLEDVGREVAGAASTVAKEILGKDFTDDEQVLARAEETTVASLAEGLADYNAFKDGGTRSTVLSGNTPRGVTPATLALVDRPEDSLLWWQSAGDRGKTLGNTILKTGRNVWLQDLTETERAKALAYTYALSGGLSVDAVVQGSGTIRYPLDTRLASRLADSRLGDLFLATTSDEEVGRLLSEKVPGARVERLNGKLYLTQKIDLKDAQPHPTLSLYVKDEGELSDFLQRPDAERRSFHSNRGFPVKTDADLKEIDARFAAEQRRILKGTF